MASARQWMTHYQFGMGEDVITVDPIAQYSRQAALQAEVSDRVGLAKARAIIGRAWLSHGARTFMFEAGMYGDFLETDLPQGLEASDVLPPFPVIRIVFEGEHTVYFGAGDELGPTGSTGDARFMAQFLPDTLDVSMVDLDFTGAGHSVSGTHCRCSVNAVINAILYLSSPSAVMEPADVAARVAALRAKLKRAKGRYKRKIREEIKTQTTFAEGTIVVKPPTLRLPSIGTGPKVNVRFKVRGHWRNQACGRRRSERKRIWIAPHWKGPDTAEMIARDYRVDRPQGGTDGDQG